MEKLKIGDICMIVGIPVLAILLAVCFFLVASQGDVAVVKIDDREICRLPLDKDIETEINDGTHILVIKDGQVSVKEAKCPDGLCQGYPISQSGQSIVCLPYHLVVTVEEGLP